MRATDVIGRLGGEEFVAIVPGTAADAAVVGERVRAAFEVAGVGDLRPRDRRDRQHRRGRRRMPAGDVRTRCWRARTRALYRAKAGGRNRVEIAPDESPPAERHAPASRRRKKPLRCCSRTAGACCRIAIARWNQAAFRRATGPLPAAGSAWRMSGPHTAADVLSARSRTWPSAGLGARLPVFAAPTSTRPRSSPARGALPARSAPTLV